MMPPQNLPPKHQQQQQHRYDIVSVTPEPPELPAKRKNPLKSPLKALKKAIVKGTNSLRRQASFMEPSESKKQKSLRRQHSMMERGSNRTFYSPQHHPNGSQDYYEYQQQQYHNYYQQQQQPYYPQDERYAWYQRHERYYPANGHYDEQEPLYGNYGPPPQQQPPQQAHDESIYANRAFIELERRPRGIIRRHSMNEKQQPQVPAFATLAKRRSKYVEDIDEKFSQMAVEEPIYQSQRGSYMYQEQQKPRRQYFERPIEDNQKLLQVRKDLNSPGTSSASSMSSPSRDKNLRDSRRQLKDQIYQSRIDAMQSMAEPNYLTRSSSGGSTNTGNLRSQPIYESKKEVEADDNDKSRNETVDTSNEIENEQEKSLLEAIEETILMNQSQDQLNEQSMDEDIPFADDEATMVNKTDETSTDGSLQCTAIENPVKSPREPLTLLNIIKRAAPPPPPIRSPTTTRTPAEPVYESQTSIDTQASLGPPNAQSTPYASELTLKEQMSIAKARFLASPPMRQATTTKGCFDEEGGILEDKVWNVSLIIPPGALQRGVKQEIYFTVTDPRMSDAVGGPTLDIDNGNGWF